MLQTITLPYGVSAFGADDLGTTGILYRSALVPEPITSWREFYDLAVGKFEITRAQWQEFVTATGYKTEDGCQYFDGHF